MMSLKNLGRLAMAVLLGAMLTGCIDAQVDVELTSSSTAKAMITQVMGADFYTMIKMNAEQAANDGAAAEDGFCTAGALTENRDGTATCLIMEQGRFDELTMGIETKTVEFAPAGPGLVRLTLPTQSIKHQIGADEAMDEESKQMVEAFFAGRGVTIRFSGLQITDTNMTLSKDGRSAQQKILFLDLLRGNDDLPEELYAVVRVPR